MADNVSFDIEGLDDLLRKLQALGPRVGGNALVSAVRAGAAIVVKDARRRAPKRTGNLRRNIRSAKQRQQSRNEVSFNIGFAPKAYYGVFIEKGTRNMAAQPFLRPAAEATKDDVIQRIADKLKERIEKAK